MLMYTLSKTKAQSIEPDVPVNQEPIYGVVACSEEGVSPSSEIGYTRRGPFRLIIILDRAGGILRQKQAEIYPN